MRLWSIHPKYLDCQGLLGLWREALLAQKVLSGETEGYTNHPQLERLKKQENPLGAIATYLFPIRKEGQKREYNFDRSKIEEKQLRPHNNFPLYLLYFCSQGFFLQEEIFRDGHY